MKQFGLIVSDPSQEFCPAAVDFVPAVRAGNSLLRLHGRPRAAVCGLSGHSRRIPFPRGVCADAARSAASGGLLLRHLSGDAQPGNVIRKYTCLQLSFLPYLRPGRAIVPLDGGVRIGDNLLVLRLSDEGTIDASLPDGLWAELSGLCWTGRCRQIRGYNALPVLIRENALFPVGVNDRATDADDADRVVLHWFQPDFTTECTLADGTFYRVTQIGAGFRWETNATKEWHLIIHRGSEEQFVR